MAPHERKTRLSDLALLGVVLALTALGGCRSQKQRTVNLVGSTSVQPFAELLAQEYQSRHPELNVEVQGGGSTAGIQALENGIAEIGMSSRSLTEAEKAKGLVPIAIARDGLAIVVHPSNGVTGLSRQQIQSIFSGLITNWRQVGGSDMPIRPITREEGSGTREEFIKRVMGKVRVSRGALVQESNGAVKELVRGDPGAIGYMSLGLVGGELKVLAVDGVEPSVEGIAQGKYPLAREFLFVRHGELSSDAQAFVDFVLSDDAQHLLESEGLVRTK